MCRFVNIMPKLKQIEKCKHPESRKTKALAKQLKKQTAKNKAKLSTNIKRNLLGEKLVWFRDNLSPDQEQCTPNDVELLILKYLGRFDGELEQIKLKHSIGQRKNRQHANREDIINMTLKSEREEFKGPGIELPDLFNPTQLKMLKEWTGELRFLQNFKLRRFSLRNLKDNSKMVEKKQENKQVVTKKPEKDISTENDSNERVSRDDSNFQSMDVDSL